MKYPFLALGMIMVGMSGLVFITMFQSITVNNESEYYVLKEAMKASMLESVDLTCYRSNENEGCGGVLKISEQKFVENFTRRFAKSINGDAKSYTLEFYDIIESPPKASVIIRGNNGEYKFHTGQSVSGDIANALTGILETNNSVSNGNDAINIPDVDINLSNDSDSNYSNYEYGEVYDEESQHERGAVTNCGGDDCEKDYGEDESSDKDE